ncbi:MAG: hypothetical protein H0U67_07335 [Gemmatimonadetes bacterium]|jgi:hypothetical protein|nr:hypothetical protein [Gemmatimonadota bacterium]
MLNLVVVKIEGSGPRNSELFLVVDGTLKTASVIAVDPKSGRFMVTEVQDYTKAG